MGPLHRCALVALASSACFGEAPPPTAAEGSTSTPSTSTGSTGDAASSTTVADTSSTTLDVTTTTSDSGADSDSTTSAPTCGDGEVDVDEQCDDGNQTPGDGCTECVPSLSTSWLRTFGASGATDAAFSIAVRPGRLVVSGALAGTNGDPDLWIELLDEDGESQGRHLVGGAAGGDDALVDVRLAVTGDVWATGGLNDGGIPQTQIDVRRLSADLEVEWVAAEGLDNQPDRATGLGLVTGGAVVGGILGNVFANDAWFGRYDGDGALVESYVCDCGAFGGVLDVASDASSVRAVVIDGLDRQLWGFDDMIEAGPAWTATLDATEPTAVVALAPGGDAIVCGGIGGSNDIRMWLARFDPSGDELWSAVHDLGDGDHSCQAVVVGADRVLAAGAIRQDEATAQGIVARFDIGTGDLIDSSEIVVDGSADTRVLAIDSLAGVPLVAGTFAVDAVDDDAFVARLVP